MNQKVSKKYNLQITSIALAIFAFAGSLHAQETAGSISGKVEGGGLIKIENKSINIKREVKVNADGTFTAAQLPSGNYDVTFTKSNGQSKSQTVTVSAGLGAAANFLDDTVVVTATGNRTLNPKEVNNSFSISKAEIDRIPVSRDVTNVTLLAPGTTRGDGRFGNLASIGGASVAENAYYINGFNVTNIYKGVAFNEVPFDAVSEVQVKNGGYSVEYGRSLGGVVSVNTKRGTNTWDTGIRLTTSPSFSRATDVYAKKNTSTGGWDLIPSPGTASSNSISAYAGGPVIPEKLYFYGLVEGVDNNRNVFGQDNQTSAKASTPKYLVKLDWNLNENNLIELTSFRDKQTQNVASYTAASPYTSARGNYNFTDSFTTGGENNIIKWTSFLTNDLTISALAGKGVYNRINNISAANCPAIYDGRSGSLVYKGCWSEAAGLAIDDPTAAPHDTRTAYRLDLEWKLGKHTLKAGLDNEVFDTVNGQYYTGGHYYRLYTLAPGKSIAGTGYTNTTGQSIDYVRDRVYANGGVFKTKNSAFYAEDNYQLSKDVVLNLGVRSESFENLNANGESFVKITNTLAPRAGVAWDLNGNGKSKLYANAGRYYIPVYSNTNARLSGKETFYTDYWKFNGTFSPDAKSIPGLGAQLGNRIVTSNGETPDSRSIVDMNLKPMFQDQFSLGFQQAVSDKWTLGGRVTSRILKSGMDDVCEGTATEAWALKNGYTASQAAEIGAAIGHCFLTNPGMPLKANVDLNGDGNLVPVTIPAVGMLMPKAARKYNALELTADRQWDGVFTASLSYTLSWLRGNTEGYVKSDNGQDDAGITQDFDFPGLMEGSNGYLANDRRHTFKLSGAYKVAPEWQVGASFILQSGRPKNCFGIYNGSIADDSATYGAASFYCDGKLVPRGTAGRLPWTQDLSLQAMYAPASVKNLTVSADLFNVFNKRAVGVINESGELDGIGMANPDYARPYMSGLQRPRSLRISTVYKF